MATKKPFNPKVTLPKPRKTEKLKGQKGMKKFKAMVSKIHALTKLNKEGKLK